jgi:hypothetical protein
MISRRRKSATHKGDIKISGNTDRWPARPQRHGCHHNFLPAAAVRRPGELRALRTPIELYALLTRTRFSSPRNYITRDHMPICGSGRALGQPPMPSAASKPSGPIPAINKEEQACDVCGPQPRDQHIRSHDREGGGQSQRRTLTLVLIF